jgi:hypothetical protein
MNWRNVPTDEAALIVRHCFARKRQLWSATNSPVEAPSASISQSIYQRRSHDAVIHVYDAAGNVIETHEPVGECYMWLTYLCFESSSFFQFIKAAQTINPASAAKVTGTPRRAKSRKEILTPNSRACCTTMMLETLPKMIRLPPKLLASART